MNGGVNKFTIDIPLDDLRVVVDKRVRLLIEDVVDDYWFKQRMVEQIKLAVIAESAKAIPKEVAEKITSLYSSHELLQSVAGEIIAIELRAFFRTKAGKGLLSKTANLVLQKHRAAA